VKVVPRVLLRNNISIFIPKRFAVVEQNPISGEEEEEEEEGFW